MTYDFETLFYDDFFGIKWTEPGVHRVVTWSTVDDVLELSFPAGATALVVADPAQYQATFQQAFDLWSDALDSVTFVHTDQGNDADVALGVVAIDGRGGLDGRWGASWSGGIFTDTTIEFDPYGISEGDLLTTALHEIGNILGLGDIRPTSTLRSVQEDPFPENFRGDALWVDDIDIIRSYYGEGEGPTDLLYPGSAGADSLSANAGNDTMRGEGGNDILRGKDGNDVMFGGAGDDSLFGGSSYDVLHGEDDNDQVWGGNGRDLAYLGAGDDVFYDNAQNDIHAHDTVDGGAGNDTVFGGGGDDVFHGKEGADLILGGIGKDTVYGGQGADVLRGNQGADQVWGGNGADLAYLGLGNDVFTDNAELVADTVFGGAGNDTVLGGGGADVVYGNQGADLIQGGIGADMIFGGNGFDVLQGNQGNDQVWGGNGRDIAYLGQGNDVFTDNAANDVSGHDTVFGGAGEDTIYAGGGDNVLAGGLGSDRFVFQANAPGGANQITDFELGTDVLELVGATAESIEISSDPHGTLVSWEDGSVLLTGIVPADFGQDDFALS